MTHPTRQRVTMSTLGLIVQASQGPVSARLFAQGQLWYVQFKSGPIDETIQTARGEPKCWKVADTAIRQLKACGIGRLTVDSSRLEESQASLIPA